MEMDGSSQGSISSGENIKLVEQKKVFDVKTMFSVRGGFKPSVKSKHTTNQQETRHNSAHTTIKKVQKLSARIKNDV